MKTIYLDLGMGAAGDMLSAALYELLCDEDKKRFIDTMNSCGLGGVTVSADPCSKCGINGTKMNVTVDGISEKPDDGENHHEHHHEDHHEDHHEHHHHHSGADEISHMISHLDVSDTVKHDAGKVFGLIAEAESHVHNVPVTDIHFHEVGTKDAVADVVSFCLLKEMLGVEKITASYVVTGFGEVKCAHGILPVPAPATAYILKGIPTKRGNIEKELCTPTGAAIPKYFADFDQEDHIL
ncbi:MAG: LarC family nickel insertion protein, partial [Lachnospiraceae bacterium]|nr:LarC family nickel insertion protein [Lachnospiraceae bacterium]